MLAYQMIYTACGPNKTGAFDLWAKSASVTREEWKEIEKVMGYKKPRDLSYEATEEEIERLCPKKYAYIQLSSGRKCLARSNYIGKVYSDEDSRSGNFIIHAYIFDDLGDVRPSTVFTSQAFKSKLTYKEWHDDPLPTDLPTVDIKSTLPGGLEEMMRALLNGKKTQMASLLQAVVNVASEDKTVSFNADEKTQELVYHMISLLLPKKYYENATFCTRYLANSDYTFSSEGLAPIRLRNILQDGMGMFSYEEELAVGEKYVFSFDENIYSSVIPGAYVKDILESVAKGSLFEAMKKAEEIGAIAEKAGCDLDTALAIYQIKMKNLSWFTGADSFWKAYELASSRGYANKETYVPLIYTSIVKTKIWGYNASTIALTKYIFENSDVATRDAIIDDFYVNMSEYGVQASGDPVSFLNSVKNCAPFDWNEFSASLTRNGIWKARIENANTLAQNYLFFDTMLGILERGGQNANSAFNAYVINIVRKAVVKKDFNEIKLYLQRGRGMENWLVQNAAGDIIDHAHVQEDVDFAMKLILMLSDTQEKYKWMERLFTMNVSAQYFMAAYIKYEQENQALFEGFEKRVAQNPVFTAFFFKKEAYVFKNDKNITAGKLDKYFKKYYVTGNDSGVYYVKLQEYIGQLSQKALLGECIRLYVQTRGLDNNFPDLKKVVALLEREIYSLSTDDLVKASQEEQTVLKEIEMRVKGMGLQSSSRFGLVETLSLIQGKAGKEARRQAIISGNLYGSLQGKTFTDFIHKYLEDILDAYVDEFKASQKNGDADSTIFLKGVFEPIFIQLNMDFSALINEMECMSNKDYYRLLTEFAIYGFYKTDAFAGKVKHFMKVYVEQMKRGAWKKFFKKAEVILEELEEDTKADFGLIYDWFDAHRDAHKGLFDILFSKKRKDKDDEEDEEE